MEHGVSGRQAKRWLKCHREQARVEALVGLMWGGVGGHRRVRAPRDGSAQGDVSLGRSSTYLSCGHLSVGLVK